MYIADLHIHSRYSMATSKDCSPEYLDLWARRKGIHIVGTGDFTHPAWREELREKLEPAEDGLYVLKKEYCLEDSAAGTEIRPRFVVTGEISSIYKKNGKTRKVHSLILLPGLEAAERIAGKLETIGNIHSDGRPILGLDCRDLLEILLELCPDSMYVPAHIWTPHFSLFGACSGFDTVEECFGDLSSHIHAMETGLSSDPPMNWTISALDKYQLISNSDAHSPAKLGREANLLDIELSYEGLRGAVQEGKGLLGTIEFFPEEGKYHFDGHRKCHLCLSPAEAKKYGGKCPVCGRKLTMGVSHRIQQLSDREEGYIREGAKPFESLVPLPEVIGASLGCSSASVKAQRQYMEMLKKLGPEFEILRNIPLEDLKKTSGYLISQGIQRLREGNVDRIPGFDGEYGIIKLFAPWEIEDVEGQMSFLDKLGVNGKEEKNRIDTGDAAKNERKPHTDAQMMQDKISGFQMKGEAGKEKAEKEEAASEAEILNPRQMQAVTAIDRAVAVIAGPGTGKTKTLVSRILYLLETRRVKPSEITAVTFTNKAAKEMEDRIKKELGKKKSANLIQIGTFHSICMEILKKQGITFTLAEEGQMRELAEEVIKEYGLNMKEMDFLRKVSIAKAGLLPERCAKTEGDTAEEKNLEKAVKVYEEQKRSRGFSDFDDLLLETLRIFREKKTEEERRFQYLLVDEFQDISPVQYELIQAWNQSGRELFVIGDPDQAIYGFRGSDSRCFDRLGKDYEKLREIRLTANYRSSKPIVESAIQMISHNPGEKRELLARTDGAPLRLVKAGSVMGEAIFVAKEIDRLIGGIDMLDAQNRGISEGKVRGFSDIAVLYRTHRQAELLEKCLQKEGIPYVVAGRESFLMEPEVRGSISFFRYLQNPKDRGAKELSGKLLWNLESNDLTDSILETMEEKYKKIFGKSRPSRFMKQWMEDRNTEHEEAMQKLARVSLCYKNMSEMLDALISGTESDLRRCGGKHYTSDAVTLMTLHGSKGLEFPVTIIYGVNKGMIPYENEKRPADKEEERRLFYVGMTRGKEELILTASLEESEFLEEIPDKYLTREKADKRRNRSVEQLSLFDFM